MNSGKKRLPMLRILFITGISLTVMVLSGFLFSGRSAVPIGSFFGISVESGKIDNTKNLALVDKTSKNLTYKETNNRKELPVSERADRYGTYDVYTDEDDNQYIFLTDSDLFCGFLKTETPQEAADTARNLSELDARGIADAYILDILGEDQREYTFEKIRYDQNNFYYVTYVSYLGDVKTDDECVIWVRASNGDIAACSMFNRGRYDAYRNKNFSVQDYPMQPQAMQDQQRKDFNDYEVLDKYITLSDSGRLVMDYEVRNEESGCTQIYTVAVAQ